MPSGSKPDLMQSNENTTQPHSVLEKTKPMTEHRKLKYNILRAGYGVKQSYTRAIEWYKKAAGAEFP